MIASISSSNKITGLELRMRDIKILNNRTPAIWPFPGNASFYLLTITLDNISKDPKEVDLRGFRGIGDNTPLQINRTLYYWKAEKPTDKHPSQIHCMVCIIKSKAGLRKTGEILKKAKASKEYTSILENLGKVVADPALATTTAIANVVVELGNFIGSFLEEVQDQPHYTRFASFTDIAGDFDTLGENSYPDEHKSENAKCNLILFVRDVSREKKALEILAKNNGNITKENIQQLKANTLPIRGDYTEKV